MPVTLTVKQVPDHIAKRLRERAAASHRSLQGELMAILEAATGSGAALAAQPAAAYRAPKPARAAPAALPAHGRKLTLAQVWELSRRLGPPSKSESTTIVRKMRDERYGR